VICVDLGVLAEATSRMLRAFDAGRTAEDVLDAVVEVTREVVEPCEHVSVTMLHEGGPRTAAASDDAVRALDAAQYAAGEGPCLSAATDQEAVLVGDLGADRRWPALRERMGELGGVTSVLAVPISAGRQVFGSLNVSASDKQAFDTLSQQLATVLAGSAASLLMAARDRDRAEQVHRQLAHCRRRTRDLESYGLRTATELRSGLMTLQTLVQVLRARSGQLDEGGQQALVLLTEELRWHEDLSLSLVQARLPQPRSDDPQRPRPRSRVPPTG
jgi:transcriptional regulator with GAF, ATPase, and Fis domain